MATNSNRREPPAPSGGPQDEVLARLLQNEWPLPQPRPDDALQQLIDAEEVGAQTPTARPTASGSIAAGKDDEKNYYVEYMLRPGALGASETARFRNAAQLVRQQHIRLADKVSSSFLILFFFFSQVPLLLSRSSPVVLRLLFVFSNFHSALEAEALGPGTGTGSGGAALRALFRFLRG